VSPDFTLAVFAKAPIPGRVKTRLCPPLTAAQAARLHVAFVRDTVRKVALHAPNSGGASRPILYHSGDPAGLHGPLADLPPVAWAPQGEGDLGARMARVPAPCLILGTDSPHLPAARLRQAVDALRESDVVLGPADDGGYYLIGLRAPQPALFDGIAWSTSQVLAQTLARAETLGLRVAVLPPYYDIDTPTDLRRLRTDLAAGVVAGCPDTCAVLEMLAAVQLF